MDDNTQIQSILFVDDEKGILKALNRLFLDEDCDIYLASSGANGLEILKENRIDLVVSDVRMPEMDGIEFINQVKKLYPQVIRIFLTGYADKEAMAQALANGNVQQILPKPWDDDELVKVVRSALDQAFNQNRKHHELQEIINSLTSLPPMPQTYAKAEKYLNNHENFSLPKAAEIIENDISLSAELIRWANSSLFGQRHQVETVQRALVVLGSEITKGILLAGSIFKLASPKKEIPGFNNKNFFTHCVSCAVLAKKLIELSSSATEEMKNIAFTAGLLHDIGKLVEEDCLREQFQEIIKLAEHERQLIRWAEKEILGATHEEIGAYLAQWWNMPSFLINAIRWHHDPDACNFDKEIIQAVSTANNLSHYFNLGKSGNFHLPEIDNASLSRYGLEEKDLEKLKEEVNKSLL